MKFDFKPDSRPLVMGIVNVTPNSFSDGGQFLDTSRAIDHAFALREEGADFVDVGGESTRPGADEVAVTEELDRIMPIVEALVSERVPVSVDTRKPKVMRAAIEAGCAIVNDVYGFRAEGAIEAVADADVGLVAMHMQGDPRTMQQAPRYDDVVGEVAAFLAGRAGAAMAAGVGREKIWLDPGIGFGKTPTHNLDLLRHLDLLVETGFPVLLGVSRKRFIRSIDETAVEADDRLGGSLAGALWGAAQGVKAVRVHDVRETVQALKVWAAIEEAGE